MNNDIDNILRLNNIETATTFASILDMADEIGAREQSGEYEGDFDSAWSAVNYALSVQFDLFKNNTPPQRMLEFMWDSIASHIHAK